MDVNMREGVCGGERCKKRILWIRKQNGPWIPADFGITRIVTSDGAIVSGYVHHWDTCLDAPAFHDPLRREEKLP